MANARWQVQLHQRHRCRWCAQSTSVVQTLPVATSHGLRPNIPRLIDGASTLTHVSEGFKRPLWRRWPAGSPAHDQAMVARKGQRNSDDFNASQGVSSTRENDGPTSTWRGGASDFLPLPSDVAGFVR